MSLLHKLKNKFIPSIAELGPAAAYDIWSGSYDEQPGNLMLDLDNMIFSGLLEKLSLKGKVAVDIGCGTGRHWPAILQHKPAKLLGYDVSSGMLSRLKEKFPSAETYQLQGNELASTADESCDIVISTLALAHIENVGDALKEWSRILKKNGDIIITDYHPEAFKKGADRTFLSGGQTIAIKNYIHDIETVLGLLKGFGFDLLHIEEHKVGDDMRHYYETRKAIHVFEKFKGIPIIYGAWLKKKDVTDRAC